MRKPISQRAAWLKLAAAWRKPAIDDDGECAVNLGYGLNSGLCPCIYDLWELGLIDYRTHQAMLARIPPYIPGHHVWSKTRAGARDRVRFCAKQAAALERKRKA